MARNAATSSSGSVGNPVPGFAGRLFRRPVLAGQILVASLVINLLGLASSIYVIQVFNRYVGYGLDSTLHALAIGMVLALILEFGFRHLRQRLATATVARPERLLANRIFSLLARAKIAALNTMPPGSHQQVFQGLDTVQNVYAPVNLLTLVDLPFALIFLFAIFLLNPNLGLVALIIVVFSLVVTLFMGALLRRTTQALIRAQAEQTVVVGSVQQEDTVRGFNAFPFLLQQWNERSGATRSFRHLNSSRHAFLQSTMQSFNGVMTLIIIGMGASLAVAGEMDTGTLIGANILAARALVMVSRFAQLGGSLAQARQIAELIGRFSHLPLEPEQGTNLNQYTGRVEFKDFAFRHAGSSGPLFESLSLTLEPGDILLVTGDNGSGKTTFARLLMGLIEPTRGSILLDGVDLRQLQPEWWRQQVVYLPQEPAFMHGTLRQNLSLLNPGIADEELLRLLRLAGLGRFIDESQQGLDQILVNRGENLALGIRRRLALVRAMVSEGGLVILDEPTEALDASGTAIISDLVRKMHQQGRTLVVCSSQAGILKSGGILLDLNKKPVPEIHALGQHKDAITQVWKKKELVVKDKASIDGSEPLEKIALSTHLFGFMIVLLFAGFGAWSYFAKLDVVSIANGEIVPVSKVQQVQHLEGGIIREILVKEGETVDKGQPLVLLDSIATGTDVGSIRLKIQSLRADLVRYHAEADGNKQLDFSDLKPWSTLLQSSPEIETAKLAVSMKNSDAQLFQQSRSLFKARWQSLLSALEAQQDDIVQRKEDIKEFESRLKNQKQSLKLLEEQVSISKNMLSSTTTSRYEHINLLKALNDIRSQRELDLIALRRARAALQQSEKTLAGIRYRHEEEVWTGLERTQRELSELELNLRKYEDNMQRTVLRAPVLGTIKTLHITSRGGVIAPGETILEIVPGKDRLIVEAKLAAQDVGHVTIAQPAVIRLASMDADRFGKLDGVVLHISPDTLVDKAGIPYYVVRITTDQEFFEHGLDRYNLVPGVIVTAGIVTGRRSVMEYLLKPFLSGFHFAFSER